MKLRKIIAIGVITLFLLLSTGLILGFFYQDVSDNYEDILSLSTESHRGDQISTKDLMLGLKMGEIRFLFWDYQTIIDPIYLPFQRDWIIVREELRWLDILKM